MASEQFPGLPPFPEDVPTMALDRLSLAKLLEHDDEEYRKFCRACEDVGFFYLDLRSHEHGASILSDVDTMFQVSEQLFGLDAQEKVKYDFSERKSSFGYKPLGAYVIDIKGNVDRQEFYDIARDDLLGYMESFPRPDVVDKNQETFKHFAFNTQSIIVRLILDLLNEHLQLPQSTLANLHRIDRQSGDMIRLTRCPPQPFDDKAARLGEHTDFGSVTVLFNRLGGLQVLVPGTDAEWRWVKPLPGHCVVNLGDALVKFTNGLLRSNIHRVVASPGEQANCTRYSLGYFARPENMAILKRLEGSAVIPPLPAGVTEDEVTSVDWVTRRGLGKRISLHKEQIDFAKYSGTEQISRRIRA